MKDVFHGSKQEWLYLLSLLYSHGDGDDYCNDGDDYCNYGDDNTIPPKDFQVIMLILKSLILTFGHLLQHNKVAKSVQYPILFK